MNKIAYYADQNGEIRKLFKRIEYKSKTDKNSRIRFNTIHRYVRYLRNYGTWDFHMNMLNILEMMSGN